MSKGKVTWGSWGSLSLEGFKYTLYLCVFLI